MNGPPPLPDAAQHVVVGGGIHGLSVAAALATRVARSGRSPRVVLIERSRVGAGASGIAGGIVRGYYRSPAIMEIVRMSVEQFERTPDAWGFRQVGFLAVVPNRQAEDLEVIAARQEEVGYRSELVRGYAACVEYLTWLWPDFDATGVAAVLHERRSGWADAAATLRELTRAAVDAGVAIHEDAQLVGFERSGGSVETVLTNRGAIRCEHVVLACGAWTREPWRMLGLEPVAHVGAEAKPLVDLVKAQEGDFVLPGAGLQSGAGHEAPVVHFDAADALVDPSGRVVHPGPWGIYFRMGRTGTGIAVGGLPVHLGPEYELEPYGPDNPAHAAGAEFVAFAQAGLARVLKRFRGREGWQASPHGGLVGLTPDGYPVLDHVEDNVYAIIDAGHTFKMLALGSLAAADIVDGGEPRLDPFRLSRFEAGALQPASRSPYPWT